MATDPPAPDLGAIRGNHPAPCYCSIPWLCDVNLVLAAYDAQTARLAAVEGERDQQTALVRQWDERDHAKTVRIAELERERDATWRTTMGGCNNEAHGHLIEAHDRLVQCINALATGGDVSSYLLTVPEWHSVQALASRINRLQATVDAIPDGPAGEE